MVKLHVLYLALTRVKLDSFNRIAFTFDFRLSLPKHGRKKKALSPKLYLPI
jgi:hypothetical protein